jgi:RimJ/RimL family protein N-acetyltransferase
LVSAHADPEMRRWTSRHLDDEQQALAALVEQRQQWELGTRFVFAVVAGEAGDDPATPIGGVSIRRFAKEPDAAEVGYWTAPQARGKSVAPRAVEGVLAWALERWADDPVARFNLIHGLENLGSCRVAAKLGFALARQLPPFPPKYLEPGHLHVRHVD